MPDGASDTLNVTVTKLEMRKRPADPPPPTPSGRLSLLRADAPPVHFYRYLYNTVGEPWLWWERRLISDAELAQEIHDENVDLLVLYVDGAPAGYAEIDARAMPGIEIAYFGLMPEMTGRGYGRYLMHATLEAAWDWRPGRVWLHTCTLDHPGALPFYQRMGFQPFARETKEIADPRSKGLFP